MHTYPPTLPDPGERVIQLTELWALNDNELVQFYERAAELEKSPDRRVWAAAVINKQHANLLIKERGKKAAHKQMSLFESEVRP